MLDRSFINKEYPPVTFEVEKQRLRFFSKATGQTDPVYFDEAAARDAGYPGILAPPTFLATVPMEQDNPFAYLDDLKVDIGRILHGDQHYCYLAPIYAGDTITMTSRIADMFDKKGGQLQFCCIKSTFTNQHNALVATLEASFVVR